MILLLCWTLLSVSSMIKCVTLKSKHDLEDLKDFSFNSTVVLLHVLFRHGDRTPLKETESYKNDPYINETFHPVGFGQLTKKGKEKMFNVGVSLRKTYNTFLGDVYSADIVEARSTNTLRTKISILLLLAGLFPPKDQQMWNNNLPWQPIPYDYYPTQEDEVLSGIRCPRYLQLYEEHEKSRKHQEKLQIYSQIFKYISQHSGNDIRSFKDIYHLYFGLTTEKEWGLTLPKWARMIFPQLLTLLTEKEYEVQTATMDMKRLASGFFLKKIIEDTKKKIHGLDSGKGLHLYSGHEANVVFLLMLLDVYTPHIPKYGSYVILEVHSYNKTHGIKIIYQDYSSKEPKVLKMPGCDILCPLDMFEILTKKYIPSEQLSCQL